MELAAGDAILGCPPSDGYNPIPQYRENGELCCSEVVSLSWVYKPILTLGVKLANGTGVNTNAACFSPNQLH